MHKTYGQPYLGIVEGHHFNNPELRTEKRSRMKIMLFDQNKDLPIATLEAILQKAIDLYKNGEIKLHKHIPGKPL